MNLLKLGTKSLIGAAGISAFAALVFTVQDINLNNDNFMNDNEIRMASSLDNNVRFVASNTTAQADIFQAILSYSNPSHREVVLGVWELVKGQNESGVFFDKSQNNETSLVNLELTSDDTIELIEEGFTQKYKYKVESFNNALLVLKSGENEVTLKKIVAEESIGITTEITDAPTATNEEVAEEVTYLDLDHLPRSVLYTKVSPKILEGLKEDIDAREVTGSMTGILRINKNRVIVGGSIDSLDLTLSFKNKQVEISGSATVNDAGQLDLVLEGRSAKGMIMFNGQGGFRMNVYSGQFAGAMVNFLSQDDFDNQIEKKRVEAERKQEELEQNSYTNEIANDTQTKAVNERARVQNVSLKSAKSVQL